MTNPITLHPVHDTVEGMQFTDSVSAWEIAKWLQDSLKDAHHRLSLHYGEDLYGPSEFTFSTGDDSYELRLGDWVIRDGGLFAVVRRADLPYRYVNGIEKIKLEAGMR
jgi:hypothetical protein